MGHLTDSPRLDLDIAERATQEGAGWMLERPERDLWAWADAFTPDECDSIIEIANRQRRDTAETLGRSGQTKRDSGVTFLYPSGHTDWIFRRLTDTVTTANKFFEFDLTCFAEGIQFTEYLAPGGKYDWHVDAGPGVDVRKLSLTIQLTDPDDYEGGELELNPDGEPVVMNKVRGRAFVFPSWTLHRVKPVTAGVRHSLVAWIAGPAFK